MLCELIDYTYQGNTQPELIEKYKKFSIEYNNKLSNTNASYSWKKHKITIRNLYRDETQLKFDSIRCLAHHIDFRNRGVVNSQWEFYAEYERLMRAVLELGLLSIVKVYDTCNLEEKEQKVWFKLEMEGVATGNYKADKLLVKVKNAYAIREELKYAGYKFSSLDSSWEKEINIDASGDEIEWLSTLTSLNNITTHTLDSVLTDPYIWIYVYESFEQKRQLKAAGYVYDGKEKAWKKKFPANEVELEINDLSKIGLLTIRTKKA